MAKVKTSKGLKSPRMTIRPVVEQGNPLQQTSMEHLLQDHTEKFAEHLTAFSILKACLEPKLGTLVTDIGFLREGHKKLKNRVQDTETELAAVRPSVVEHHQQIESLQKEVAMLRARWMMQRYAPGGKTFKVVGLPKRVKELSIDIYLETWLIENTEGQYIQVIFCRDST
ncbi:hypothetical protein NDU88_006290 [Pleurodeles waltl]|uniref:Uncharacterized protein n=1 Tax=Pleurodeles waltl TaxID=8319 RepID=A0AAV7RL18_PLEWA|nr:hypothetical protein NDU88_006290 [Pleurodeles waltl]